MAYIEKETLKEELLSNAVRLNDTKNMSTEDVLFIIDKQPDADVVEVVRCKDCKHCYKAQSTENTYFCCVGSNAIGTELDDFCSYGERKENE